MAQPCILGRTLLLLYAASVFLQKYRVEPFKDEISKDLTIEWRTAALGSGKPAKVDDGNGDPADLLIDIPGEGLEVYVSVKRDKKEIRQEHGTYHPASFPSTQKDP
jgi:hypothetical protein